MRQIDAQNFSVIAVGHTFLSIRLEPTVKERWIRRLRSGTAGVRSRGGLIDPDRGGENQKAVQDRKNPFARIFFRRDERGVQRNSHRNRECSPFFVRLKTRADQKSQHVRHEKRCGCRALQTQQALYGEEPVDVRVRQIDICIH